MVKTENIEQEKPKEIPSWKKGLDMNSVRKVAELNILPSIKIDLGDIVNLKIHSLPTPTKFADGNTYETMLVELSENIYQLNCNAESFKFQFAVLSEKHFNGIDENMVGHTIQVSKIETYIDTPKFKGKAEVYQISLVK
jgi:hypothetical protein